MNPYTFSPFVQHTQGNSFLPSFSIEDIIAKKRDPREFTMNFPVHTPHFPAPSPRFPARPPAYSPYNPKFLAKPANNPKFLAKPPQNPSLLCANTPESAKTSENSEKTCEICKSSPYKYRCPSCNAKTCSLSCVKSHKISRKCLGLAKPSKFIHKSRYTPLQNLKDYNFLNEIATNIEKTKRKLSVLKRKHAFSENLRYKLLRNFARKLHGIEVLVLPAVFLRHRSNLSFFFSRERCIYWSLELIFCRNARIFAENPVKDSTPVAEIVVSLAKLSEKQDFRVFFEDSSRNLHEVSKESQLSEALKGSKIIEFPSFHVVFAEELSEFSAKHAIL